MHSDLAYRIPFAIQFIFPALLLAGLPFCPESPYYLLRSSDPVLALSTLSRLGYPQAARTLSHMTAAMEHEAQGSSNASYADCFRGSDARRTEIGVGVFAVCQLSGVVFTIGYSSYFFELAGLSTSLSYSLSIGVTVLGLVGTMLSWLLINTAGRRPSFICGTIALAIIELLIGILAVLPSTLSGATGPVFGQSALVIVFACVYFLTIGPMAWAIFAEIPSSRLRSRTIGLGILTQNLFGIILSIAIPYLINPDEADLKGLIGFIFAGLAALGAAWSFWRIPETKGRGFAELDRLFEMRVATRKFGGWVLE